MLFKRQVLEGIARGEVTLAFRRWKRPQIRSSGRLRTALGEVRFGEVQLIEATAVSENEARKAGFETLAALMHDLHSGDDRQLFRIEINGLDDDTRAELRADDELDDETVAVLTEKLQRWDQSNNMAGYHRGILKEISENPGVPAARLADLFKVEKMKFKRDVSKLKDLCLTESLDLGYRLSPRGARFLQLGK
jgi:hypothetical protein